MLIDNPAQSLSAWAQELRRRTANPARVIVLGATEIGLEIAVEHPEAVVEVYEPTWEDVDRGRALAASRGLDGRIVVRPRLAATITRADAEQKTGPRRPEVAA